jgi:Rrf2 family protein
MITLTGEYALRAMAYMAQLEPGEYTLVRDIGKNLDIPINYLGKVMLALAREGILESQRGRNGGFRLARPAKSIRLFEILAAVEPVKRYEHCILGRKICSDETACPIHHAWIQARGKVLKLFHDTPLTALAEHELTLRSLTPTAQVRASKSSKKESKTAGTAVSES